MFVIVICLVYLDHLKFCVVCSNGLRYVCYGECYVVCNECDEPTSCLVQPISVHCCEVMYLGCFGFRGELGLLNCDDSRMCVVNKQFQLLEFVFDSFYVDWLCLSVSMCCVCSNVVIFGLSVSLVPTTPACTWWNRPEEDLSSGKSESTHPSRTVVKSIEVFYGVESVVRGNADSLLN